MEALVLLALFGAAALLPIFSSDDTDEVSEEEDDPILVGNDDVILGTAGDDIFNLAGIDAPTNYFSIDGGDGNDLIDLSDLDGDQDSDDPLVGSATISGGSGDDTIAAGHFSSVIDGGDGNDEIRTYHGDVSTVTGGAGDDYLIALGGLTDLLRMDGGEGNDTLDGSALFNANLFGGDGDDLLILQGIADGGAGYVVNNDGGAGDDVLRYTGPTAALDIPPIPRPMGLVGGSGTDLFELTISEGAIGNGPFEDPDAPMASENIVWLHDFDSDVEMIEINAQIEDPSYSVTQARLEEGRGSTNLRVRYEAENGFVRDVVIRIAGLDVDWGNIEFVGANVPALVPLGEQFT